MRSARTLFYAGARSLLVSRWEVASESTVKLIAKAVGELKSDPAIRRAEALCRSMLSMLTGGKNYQARPALWARGMSLSSLPYPFPILSSVSAVRWVSFAMSSGESEMRSRNARPLRLGAYG